MWHYLLPVIAALPCFALWTYVSSHESFGSIQPISLYGMAFLGNCVSFAQPAALSYRTSTLYGASEQAVGGASAVAALSIASIIGPQVSNHGTNRTSLAFADRTPDLPGSRQAMVSEQCRSMRMECHH